MDIVRSRPAAQPLPLARPDAAPAKGRTGAPTDAGSTATPAQAASLWHVLTPEERAFFEQAANLGPLTYRPGREPAAGPEPPTGRRLDVRG